MEEAKDEIPHDQIFLARDDIIKLKGDDPDLYLKLIEKVLKLHSNKECIIPNESYLRFGGVKSESTKGRYIAMPAHVGGGLDIAGIKWISSHPQNQSLFNFPRAIGIVILNDATTGIPKCVMEGGLISAFRTAAVTTLAVEKLAKKDSKVLSLIGTGVISSAHMRFFSFKGYDFDEIKIFDKSNSSMLKFKERMEKLYRFPIKTSKDAESAIRNSDIIITATTTTEPYLKNDWVSRGSLFCNVSLFDPEDDVILDSDKIVVDDITLSANEGRPLSRLLANGFLSKDKIHAELGEIISGKKKGRESEEEKIFFNPMGLAIEDLIVADEIYKRAKNASVGQKLSLGNFWTGLI